MNIATCRSQLEIAEAMHLSRQTVSRLLSDAIQKKRKSSYAIRKRAINRRHIANRSDRHTDHRRIYSTECFGVSSKERQLLNARNAQLACGQFAPWCERHSVANSNPQFAQILQKERSYGTQVILPDFHVYLQIIRFQVSYFTVAAQLAGQAAFCKSKAK